MVTVVNDTFPTGRNSCSLVQRGLIHGHPRQSQLVPHAQIVPGHPCQIQVVCQRIMHATVTKMSQAQMETL